MFRHALRILAMLLCWIIPLNALAVPIEVVTLEEEPADAQSDSDAPKKKKKKRKKKKAEPPPDEASSDSDAEEPSEDEDPEPPKKKRRKKKAAADEEVSVKEEEPDEPPVPIECMPELAEVETRRPIPLACTVAAEVTSIELRYRPPGEQWKTLKLKKQGEEWLGEIPCSATVKAGELEFSASARSKKGKVAGKLEPLTVKLAESTSEPPPAIPGQEPPARCFDPSECPGDMLGTDACPGTKKGKGVRSWGASCTDSKECTKGLACVAGTCESPPKCETDAECDSGMCSNGVCEFPDPEDLKDQIGPPKFNWVSLELGVDFMLLGDAIGVCGTQTDDAERYTCFEGGTEYSGTPNINNAGVVAASFKMATMRVMASYQRSFGRIMAGARLGFAFRGAPDGFLPLHLEGRVAYSLRADPLKRRLRPYLGLGLGVAQVDTKVDVTAITCTEAGGQTCVQGEQITETQIQLGHARVQPLTAYRSGKKFFAGPTISVIYALSNESALVGNLNVMFPDVVIAPSFGYMLGI